MHITALTPLGRAFAVVVNGICAMVARYGNARGPFAVVLTQVYWRIARRVSRLDRLVQHWHAGTLPKPRAPRASPPRLQPVPDPSATPEAPRTRTPDGRGMLLHLVQQTAQFRGHFETFLERPDTRALVRVAPQAGRILRPLCRILAIDLPAYLRPPPRPRPIPAPVPPEAAASRLPPNHPPEPADRPLPAYVLAAARAWKKYDL